ncbi:MAG: choice-of-anchor Q domain-containing protein [Arcicella sp.]|nr:choice-of-anchor Q domain-containing protein [Arcicella sp.]
MSTCTATATTMVTVNTCTIPTYIIAGSNSPVTAGTFAQVTASARLVGLTFAWTGPNGFTSAFQNPTVSLAATPANSGVYSVTVSLTPGNTCSATATAMLTVIPAPCNPPTLATAGSNSPVVATTPLNLTSSATGGTAYAWTGPNGFTSTMQNPTVSSSTIAAMAGVYTVTIASSAGSTCTATATTMVTVNTCTIPTYIIAGSNSPVTAGTFAQVTASARLVGLTFAWTGPNGFTSAFQNPTVSLAATPANSGVYSVTVSLTPGNTCSATATAMLTVLAPTCMPPTLAMAGSNSPVTVGTALNLTSSAAGGTAYAWAGPNGFTSTMQNPTVSSSTTAAMAGVYTVTIASAAGSTCTATATTLVVVNPVMPTSSVVYVNIANTNTPQNGSSWATAYANLQLALALAPANSDFWVAKGVYKPTASTNRIIPFIIPSGARLFGGFAGTETMLSQSNVEANPTILSGEIGSPTTVNDNSYHVVTFNRTNSDTRLDGFTVTGGNASFNSTRPPSSTSNTAQQPLSIFDGGGIGLDNGSSPTIINCKIISNDAIQGGGLYATNNSNPTVTNCVFMNNQATFGGGIYNLNSSPTYSNILIAGNRATGGGMYNNGSNPTITNVTIAGNGGFNGAIFNSNSAPVVKNSILWGNVSPFNDTQSITTYSIVEGGYAGIGNLNVDPQFVNPVPNGLSPSLSGDYKLTNTSPAIDAGDNGMIGLTDIDLMNNSRRFNGGIVDIGAYEFQGSRMGGTVTSIVSGNWEQGTTWSIGRKPGAGDTVIINTNHIVTINSDGVIKNIEIKPNATLLYKTSGIKLQTGF